MFLFDLLSMMLIGMCHIYLFQLFLGNTNMSMRVVVLMSVLFTTLLSLALAVTGLVELNIVLLSSFLVMLGLLQRTHSLAHIIYFALLSMVIFTIVKNGMIHIALTLYLESPFNYYSWTPSAVTLVVLLFIAVLLFWARRCIELAGRSVIHSRLYVVIYSMMIICTIFLLIINYPTLRWFSDMNSAYGEQMYIIVLLVVLILLTLLTIFTYVSKERLIEEHKHVQHEQLLAYVEKLEFLHDELTTFRHDYTNILVSLDASIRANDLAQIRSIYEQTIAPTAMMMNDTQLELTKLANIAVPEVKSLLSMKILTAQRKAVHVQLDIPEVLTCITIPMDDYLRMLSILLDNAIEAAEQSNDKHIQIALFTVQNCQYIVVKNSTPLHVHHVAQLYDKHASTKGRGRGIGLFSVQRLVRKHPHMTLATTMDGAVFTQELVIKHRS